MKKRIGITGAIATGKSQVTNYLIDKGYVVIDCDKISHSMLDINGLGYNKTIDSFGLSILNSDKSINRNILGNIVFNSLEKLNLLNSILHPLILKEMERQMDLVESNYVFADVPLLYEEHLEGLFDKVVVVYTNKELQLKRLMERDNISSEMALKRINAQIDIDKKATLADYVIVNNGNLNLLYSNIDKFLEDLED